MKNFKVILIICILAAATACSSRYNYIVDPTPIVKGKTAYSVKSVKVTIAVKGIKLTKGSEVKGYLSEADMGKAFQEKITNELKKNNILDTGKNDGYNLSININYKRSFAVNSNQVIHPDFSYDWVIEKDNKSIASFASGAMTMSGLSLAAEFARTGRSDINPQAEFEYIEMISKTIVEKDLIDIGK